MTSRITVGEFDAGDIVFIHMPIWKFKIQEKKLKTWDTRNLEKLQRNENLNKDPKFET
jgi:hypothetical protein